MLSPLTVARMTTPATPPALADVRGLGWDIDSSFSSNRGELFPLGSFGHTGFTGTSLWIDPAHRDVRRLPVEPRASRRQGRRDAAARARRDGRRGGARAACRRARATALRAAATSAVDAARVGAAPARARPVLTGIDVLRARASRRSQGKRVGLVTNHTGRARDGATHHRPAARRTGVTLVALFSPEHGIRGILDETVPSSRDEKTGLPIHSLYGDTRGPTDEMLQGIDTLVIDLQDIGARFYTYMTTMAYVMEEAAKRKIAVVVLDRPNPIDGLQIEGPAARRGGARASSAYFPMPIRHGMTLGELARLFNAENRIGADLTVVPMKNWTRDQWFDETGLPWVNPSPNMRNLIAGDALPGHRRDRGDEHLGRPRHRHAVRAGRRAVDRRRRGSPRR